jgi:CHAT domain-containing protein
MRKLSLLAALLFAFGAAAQGEDARALLRSAEALQQTGHRGLALEQLERARALAEPGGERELLAALRGALGKAYLLTGRREEARALLASALEAANAAGSPALVAAVWNDLGNLAAIENRAADASLAYERSYAAAREANAPVAAARAATNLARARLKAGDAAGAPRALGDAERELAAVGEPGARAALLLAAAAVLEKLRDAGDATLAARLFAAYTEAAALGGQTGDLRVLALARGGLARLYETGRRYAEAGELARLALAAAQAGGAEDTLYRWHWLAGRLLAAQGQRDEALAAYRRALQSFQAVRADLILELRALDESYRDAVAPLYLESADLMLRRARESAGQPAQQARLLEVRDLLEQFKSVELEDYFQDECVARLQAREKAIDQVSPRTAILYPVILADRVEVLLSLAGGMQQVTLEADAARITGEIHEFRRKLEKRSTREYLPHARRIYDWFFRPLEPALAAAGVDTIVLVPDGPLRGIPLAALHDGRDFLVARYAFATAPGLTLIEPQPLEQSGAQVLLTGLSEGVQQFPPLPYVTDEITAIQRLTGGTALRNAEFQVGTLEARLKALPYSIVHVATHAHFDRDPKQSFLLTYEGRLNMDGLERGLKGTRFRQNAVELLTLSACQTAAGDDRAALGLAGIAIKAGARSALATLWFINDQASSQLVTDFYGQLGVAGTSKVKALQAAQRLLLADPRYRHPGYWSPFLLIGNWL